MGKYMKSYIIIENAVIENLNIKLKQIKDKYIYTYIK